MVGVTWSRRGINVGKGGKDREGKEEERGK